MAMPRDGGFQVVLVKPGGPAEAGLRVGDQIVALDGVGLRSVMQLVAPFERWPADHPYHMTVKRGGRLYDLTLRSAAWGLNWATFFASIGVALGLLFLASAWLVFLLRPFDKQAVLLALMFGLYAASNFERAPPNLPVWAQVVVYPCLCAALFFWPVFVHLFLVFPEPSPLLRRVPRLPLFLYVPVVLLGAACVAIFLQVYPRDPLTGAELGGGDSRLMWCFTAVAMTYLAGGLLSLVLNYRQASVSSRRKLRVVVVGTVAGLLPSLLFILTVIFGDVSALNLWVFRIWGALSFLCLALLPVSFGYAIVRHQVIPVRVIIRRGVHYFLLSRGFLIVEALAVIAVLTFLLTGSRGAALDRLGRPIDVLLALAVTAATIGVLTLIHKRVMPVLDRRFFRDAYDVQQVLGELGRAVRVVASIHELLGLAALQIQRALHPEWVHVFLRDEASGDYACAHPAGGAAPLAVSSMTIEELRRSPAPMAEPAGGLLLPIVTKGDLLGVLRVGPRLSDLPYSRQDRELLGAVTWQLAFAIENTQLVRRMAEEERLRREIALASEVQRRLFPAAPPESAHLDLAGVCHPAQGVGGDYYDFLPLGEGQIGIAVADVAGKGISAALLMSVVQASLRSQARAGGLPLTELVASMNRLLYHSTDRNCFATFFYALFDERNGRLTYVNAGHNPPMLVRPGAVGRGGNGESRALRAAQVEAGDRDGVVAVAAAPDTPGLLRLCTGGLVIGAVHGATYEQECVDLVSGDVLVAYTDGVTEAFNIDGEEFGEERLRGAVLGSAHLPAAAVADCVVRSVRAWAREAPQHDDITLVVAKVR
jgi:sigma-B regulation protein RsbU (phosphoserine phosphatase)